MGLKPLQRINTGDRTLERIQDNVQDAIPRSVILDGILLSDVAIVAGTAKSVEHGLCRKPLGWWAVSPQAAGVVSETRASRSDRVLVLNASASLTTDLWVF